MKYLHQFYIASICDLFHRAPRATDSRSLDAWHHWRNRDQNAWRAKNFAEWKASPVVARLPEPVFKGLSIDPAYHWETARQEWLADYKRELFDVI